MTEPTVWIVIPARGGSKGIPRKNLKKIHGLSLIARAVAAARGAACVDRVLVSTDDRAIAEAAREAGAEIIWRPADLAEDSTPSEPVLLHILKNREEAGERLPEIVGLLQCTAPFVCAADIDGTLAALLDEGADTALTVASAHQFMWRRSADGDAEGVNHDKYVRQRRQDRPSEFLETGSLYLMRVPGFLVAGHRFFGRTAMYPVAKRRVLDIDDHDDLRLARLVAPLIDPEIRLGAIPDPLGAVVFDFDGVMTDDLVTQDENGVEAVTVSRADGLGVALLRDRGVPMAVISRERNPVVARRCRKLGLECHQACDDKESALTALSVGLGVPLEQIIYVGNDLTDLGCMAMAGLGVAVGDAHPVVRAAADLTLRSLGGRGAVRELCDLVCAALDGRR